MDIYEKVKARFTKESKKKDMLACCYCLSKFKVVDVNNFTTADSEGKKIKDDVPLCPNCFVDKVVYFNKLEGSSKEEKFTCLKEIRNFFFESEELDDSSDDDSSDDDSTDDESTDELFILPNQERLGRRKGKGVESVFKSFDKINIDNENDSDGESECNSDQECSDIYSNEDEEAYVCGSDDDTNDLEDFDNDSDMFESDSDNDYYDSGSD